MSKEKLQKVLAEQNETGGLLGELLVKNKVLSEDDAMQALAKYLSVEYVRLDDLSTIDNHTAQLIPEPMAKRLNLVAIGTTDGGKVVVAMADALDVVAADTVRQIIKRPVKVVISSPRQISSAIEAVYHGSEMAEQHLRELVELEKETEVEEVPREEKSEDNIDAEAAASNAPVVQFVNLLLGQAVKSRASDIHMEPQENGMNVRMRIDGILREMVPPSRNMQDAVITRIKILSEMNIAEHRLPQDGRFKIKTSGRDIDIRVSVIPTIYGEKIVMRILDASAVSHDLNHLGIEAELLAEFKGILAQPHGIIIVTGPTGSGKSTTLYSALNYLKNSTKNITTVEDPVEYRMEGINQIQIKPEINLNFASCLRAILRQDPDIVLIGEIRDLETVEIAIKASLTGHLVLSTFHTNDAPSALSRLVYMGIEPYLLASALNMVVAQRLVRKICDHCKEPTELTEEMIRQLNMPPEQLSESTFFRGRGCKNCAGTGYLGRLPIFEFLVMDEKIGESLINHVSEAKIRAMLRERGYGGLLQSGIRKIQQGLTTPEEVLGVTFTESKKNGRRKTDHP